jgi:hypothetical protein
MGLPEVQVNIQDPGLGIVPPGAGKTQVKLGVCQKGVANQVYSAGGTKSAQDQVGNGPLFQAAAQVLGVAGGPVLMVPVLPNTYGSVTSSFVLTGSGTGTVAAAKGPEQIVKVLIVLGGLPGVFTYRVAIGSGSYGPLIQSAADPYSAPVPGQAFTKLVFGNFTYVAADVYQLNLNGVVTRTGSGTSSALDNSTHSPVDAYDIWVEIVTSGALGAGAFRYTLDGGSTYSGSIILPSGGVYVIPSPSGTPSTGVVLTFAGTFTVGDVYKGVSSAPTVGNTEVNTAITALLANPSGWGFLHVVGTPASAAAAASLAAVVGAQMAVAQASYRFVRGIVECPVSEGDSAVIAAFVNYVDPRVGVCAGDVYLQSAATGLTERRSLAWAYTARLSAIKLSSHPGQVKPKNNGGSLRNVKSILRDETATPALDAARFVTARQLRGALGYYITRGRMMAAPGSDFAQIMGCRVMDRACEVEVAALTLELNDDPRIDPDTGHIDERDAMTIQATCQAKLEADLLSDDAEVSAVKVAVSRTDNLLSTSTLNVEVSVIPKGYTETIKLSIGFKNPALQAAA